MHIQIISFDGPRSSEVVEASSRAGRDRIAPLIEADPDLRAQLLGGFRGVGPDGAECVVILARDAAALDSLERLVVTSELLPGEDPTLLHRPSRVDRYDTSESFGHLAELLAGVQS
ncbi:MAG TPA: hypothetical protein VIR15_01150 [Intrasporangium sp.]|jgi:hypothetical protein|uniref:hypothetical protein n=1 Tax=Intrasporangium sp. TaxID=1925024 RepID=UPI002F93063F